MKGPYERLKYDLRRQWECPVCKRRERTDGSATFRHCACRLAEGAGLVVMKLVEDGVQRVLPSIAIPPGLPPVRPEPAALPETEADASQPQPQ